VRTAAPGSIVGPLESPSQGWFVMRIGERTAQTQPSFEDSRGSLTEMLRARKRSAVVLRTVRRLREAYALRVLPGAPQFLHAYLNVPESEIPAYSAQDLAHPLAQWEAPDGVHRYTFGEAIADLRIPDRDKPNAMLLPSVEQWILTEGSRRVQVIEARRRGIDRDPAFVRQLDETVNNYVLESLYTSEVSQAVTPNLTDAIAAYERNRSRFEVLEGVTLQVVDFPDSTAAIAFAAQVGPGSDLHSAAARIQGAPEVRDVDVRFPSSDPEWARIQQPLGSMSEGQGAGPYQTGSGWRMLLLVLKRTRVTPFDALNPAERSNLDQEGMELARERKLMAWVESLRREFPVAVDSARVRKLPWPVGAPGM